MRGISKGFPWATLLVNLSGCLIIGLLWGFLRRNASESTSWGLFLTVGLCGGFTTFSTFLIIGLFHPLVIKAEYYIGIKSWKIFAIAGIIFGIASIMVSHLIWSTILGVVAFSSFWSILEVIHQRERVRKGWFPERPGHKK